MKILFLNPHIDAGHKALEALQKRGVALLVPETANDAWHMLQLHGSSVDLAILHREGGPNQDPEAGLLLLMKIKADPAQADLPIILSSEIWDDPEFGAHQNSHQGVNAYLRWPFNETQLLQVVDEIFGTSSTPVAASPPTVPPPMTLPPVAPESGSGDLILEEPSHLLTLDSQTSSSSSIQLEAPPFSDEEPSPPPMISAPPAAAVPPPAPPAIPELDLDAPLPDLPLDLPSLDSSGLQEPVLTLPPETPSEPEPQAESPVESIDIHDSDAARQMPYLFHETKAEPSSVAPSTEPAVGKFLFAQPVGDAVVPGGAAQSPDTETLKKYLLLREQDVAALSTQLKEARQQNQALQAHLDEEKAKNTALAIQLDDQKARMALREKESEVSLDAIRKELAEVRFENKAKLDKARLLEIQVREASAEMEKLKDRVRADIRKIRVREKELENRLEITKKDSEVLLGARESKIIELKRKLDVLEFNMDLLQNQYSREKENSARLRERLVKAAQVVRVAGGVLDLPSDISEELASASDGVHDDKEGSDKNRKAS